jgi:hypothetical protein
MQASEKQRLFVASIIDHLRYDHRTFDEVMESTPRNNERYPDIRADCSILILAERLTGLTRGQADYVIKTYRGEQGFTLENARDIIASAVNS